MRGQNKACSQPSKPRRRSIGIPRDLRLTIAKSVLQKTITRLPCQTLNTKTWRDVNAAGQCANSDVQGRRRYSVDADELDEQRRCEPLWESRTRSHRVTGFSLKGLMRTENTWVTRDSIKHITANNATNSSKITRRLRASVLDPMKDLHPS